mmetsp:Transcript_17362/g.32547  ORF Transcript_17362/g.32547 Transcript_17362/m.32547 type:complete len:124 (-) Transcript_17362:131-502(-)
MPPPFPIASSTRQTVRFSPSPSLIGISDLLLRAPWGGGKHDYHFYHHSFFDVEPRDHIISVDAADACRNRNDPVSMQQYTTAATTSNASNFTGYFRFPPRYQRLKTMPVMVPLSLSQQQSLDI